MPRYWEGQGEAGQQLLKKHSCFEAVKVSSMVPLVNAWHFWQAVMAIGGHDAVSPLTRLLLCRMLQLAAVVRCPSMLLVMML